MNSANVNYVKLQSKCFIKYSQIPGMDTQQVLPAR
jgi:hypothetical protein